MWHFFLITLLKILFFKLHEQKNFFIHSFANRTKTFAHHLHLLCHPQQQKNVSGANFTLS